MGLKNRSKVKKWSESVGNDTKARYITRVWNELRPKLFHQQLAFNKAALKKCDLLIFDPGPIVPLKGQITQTLKLTWFDINKDRDFAEVLIFTNIFGFLVVNWTPKRTKAVNFGCVPFEPKLKILKDFSKPVFVLMETTSGQNFNKIKQYLGVQAPKKSQKRNHDRWIDTKILEKL